MCQFSSKDKIEMKHQYIVVIDKTSSGEWRFSKEDLSLLHTSETLWTASINGKTLEDQDTLIKSHQSHQGLQFSIIKRMKELYRLLRMYNNERRIEQRIIEVTKVSSIIEIF